MLLINNELIKERYNFAAGNYNQQILINILLYIIIINY